MQPPSLIQGPINSICILRLSAIGDVVNLIPTANFLHQQYPNAKITWIVGKLEAQILQKIPYIETIIYDKKTGMAGMTKLWNGLRKRKFDVLLHCQTALRASILSLGLKAKYKVGFCLERAFEKQNLFTNIKLASQDSMHVVDSYLDFVRPFGLTPPKDPQWNIELNQDEQIFAQDQIHPEMFTMILSPASSKERKNWSVEKYVEICQWAVAQGWQVIITGSSHPSEVLLANKIAEQVFAAENLTGKTTIGQLCALLKAADLVISPDSGPLHIANAFGTRVVGLYAYANPHRSGPYHHIDKTVSVYHENLPTKNVKWGYKPNAEGLMNQIKVEDVIEKIDQVLKLDQDTNNN